MKYYDEKFYEVDPVYGHDILDGYNYYFYFPKTIDFSNCLVVNPEVEEIADVEIMKQEVVYIRDVVCSPRKF